jgi:hypothetical protein
VKERDLIVLFFLASPPLFLFSASQVFSLSLYTNNSCMWNQLAHSVARFEEAPTQLIGAPRAQLRTFMDALQALPPFVGELYAGCTSVVRSKFVVGSEVSFSHAFSGKYKISYLFSFIVTNPPRSAQVLLFGAWQLKLRQTLAPNVEKVSCLF